MRRLTDPRRLAATLAALAMLVLAGCASVAPPPGAPPRGRPVARAPVPAPAPRAEAAPVLPPANSGRGGYYKDDGPGENPPAGLEDLPDADAREEPPLPRSNRPYVVLGRTYTPISDDKPFTQRGYATWYGKKFHGQRTSSGEIYDMYKMTAAHPTLPIPSYARLTDITTGKQVIVRINDRGPFHATRIVDVSYAAALKLGMLAAGSHELLLERLLPDDIARLRAARQASASRAPSPGDATPAAAAAASAAAAATTAVAPIAGGHDSARGTAPAPGPMLALVDAGANGAAPSGAPPMDVPVPDATEAGGAGAPVPPNGGFYLQLGAYSRADNADTALGKFKPYAGSLAMLSVVQGGSVYRLYSGPYASRDEALQAAQKLPASLGAKPIVVQR